MCNFRNKLPIWWVYYISYVVIHQSLYTHGSFPVFLCEGLDFTNLYLEVIDFRNCTGAIQKHNWPPQEVFLHVYLIQVDFTGVDLSNADFTQLNIPANRTGLTWKQVKSAKYMWILLCRPWFLASLAYSTVPRKSGLPF